MKIIAAIFILIIAVFAFFFLHRPKLKIAFQVVNVASDTTFQNPIWDSSDGYGRQISIRAIGEIDSAASLFINDPAYADKFMEAKLPIGKFDTTWTGEYYEKQANVVFLHRKARKGSVKIIFRYLTPDKDTLVDK